MFAPVPLEQIDGGNHGPAGGQHGIEDDGEPLVDATRQLDVIFHRLQRFLIAIQTHYADLGPRNHIQHAVHEPQSGPQNGHNGYHLARQSVDFHRTGPALDRFAAGFEIFGGLVGQQAGDFLGQHAKFTGGRALFPQQAQLMPDKGMIHDIQGHDAPPLSCGRNRRPVAPSLLETVESSALAGANVVTLLNRI